ncbi:MAG TPA: tautomerase family protein [Xanthobacteraceae bacterium]|nr:tautomerase family protein [Xanthobacteraceae bacterium]
MPHVIVKLYAGRSDKQKAELAAAITKSVMTALNHGEDAVSVGIEDVRPDDWVEKVFKPDILGKPKTIFKKPGYDPLKK